MAKIVAGIGVPHAPGFPEQVRRDGSESRIAKFYGGVARHLEAARPDAIVIFANDHFNTFFLDNFPTFAIGVAEETSGPNDATEMPSYQLAVHNALADHIRHTAIDAGFDLAVTQEFGIDHAMMVPLHFLTPKMHVPLVPIWINCFVPTLPRAQRVHALGQTVRAALDAFPEDLRVAAIASGHFSLEIGAPKVNPGQRTAIPDPGWTERIRDLLGAAEIPALVAEATAARMAKAGNIAGELLNWLAMLGTIGMHRPTDMIMLPEDGYGFAAWRVGS